MTSTITRNALDTITAALVARQSNTDDGSMSIHDQITRMRDWCATQTPPVQVGSIYEEPDVSGRRPLERRHGLKRAVADVEQGQAQMILTAYFDRFVRSVAVRAEVVQRVERAGGVVMTLDMGRTSNATAADKLSGTMLAAVAEFYADQIGEKTVDSKQRNIDRGVPPFPRITPAYIRRDDGTLDLHPVNAPLIREACRMRVKGASWLTITRWLNEHGLPIKATGVTSMMRSRLLVGEIHFGGFTPNLNAGAHWGGVVCDHTTFRQMHEKAKASRGRQAKSERLLARLGVLRCGSCDARMSVQSTTGRTNGVRYPYYRCGNKLCTRPAVISATIAEETVRDFAIEESKDVLGRASAVAELEAARIAADTAKDRLAGAIRTLAGLGGEQATRETLDVLQAERDQSVAEHDRLAGLVTPDMTVTTAADWDKLSVDERRDLIRATVHRAAVAPGEPGRRWLDRISCSGHRLGE